MAIKQPEKIKVEVVRSFRVSGLDPLTQNYDKETGVIGVGAVVTLPASFARQMISSGKAVVSDKEEQPAPKSKGPKDDKSDKKTKEA